MPDPVLPAIDRGAVTAVLEALDRDAIVGARWFGAKGRTITSIALDEAFVLDAGACYVLAIATLALDDRTRQRYTFVLTGQALREAVPGDGAWRALVVAMAEGRTIAALARTAGEGGPGHTERGRPKPERPKLGPGPVTAALVCRPAAAMPARDDLGTERDLGADQSNTGVVIGERVLLKAYRRLQPGLNPDLEMTAFLTEQAHFGAVPPLAGFAELIEAADGSRAATATTVAMAQAYVAQGADAFETIAAALVGWIRAPGQVSLDVATEIAADLGSLTAGLHAALADGRGAPEMAPRGATRAELRAWPVTARANLERALDVAPGDAGSTVRALGARIVEALTILDALPTTPELQRTHGDYHLGQVLIAPDGFRIIDFEGEPLSTPEERRAHRHPLRDVASMLRSLDHVARSAARRVREGERGADSEGDRAASSGGAREVNIATDSVAHVGLDIDAWIRRGRERFLEAYRDGLREARVWIDIDADLLRAFEVDKELYEFAYAATYLPTWLYAPTEGMRALIEGEA